MARLTNARLNAVWQIAAYLNFDVGNQLVFCLKNQPAGTYAEGNIREIEYWLKWELGKAAELGLWFPQEVYTEVIGKFFDFNYGKDELEIVEIMQPPENAAGGVGTCTCDEDRFSDPDPRDCVLWLWDGKRFNSQPGGVLSAGTWTWTGLDPGEYVISFDDWGTTQGFCTGMLTVT